jgi:hypothetical protein
MPWSGKGCGQNHRHRGDTNTFTAAISVSPDTTQKIFSSTASGQ